MTEELYYIQNRGYQGNCLIFWRPEGKGYTSRIDDAGKYTREEAERICKGRPHMDRMLPVSLVEKHIVRHVVGLEGWRKV